MPINKKIGAIFRQRLIQVLRRRKVLEASGDISWLNESMFRHFLKKPGYHRSDDPLGACFGVVAEDGKKFLIGIEDVDNPDRYNRENSQS